MKKVLIAIIGIFLHFLGSAQPTASGELTMKQLAELYNKEDYKGLYDMLSPEFRKQASEADITGFYKGNLRPMGNITSWKAKGEKDGGVIYNVVFGHGKLDLTLFITSDGNIGGMQWLPAKDDASKKKRDAKTITTNNARKTALQLAVDSAAMTHLVNEPDGGMTIAVIDGDKTEYFFYDGGGGDKTGNGRQTDASTMYEIGSITKTFTGIVLAHAVNTGKIKADADIRQYLPGTYANLEYKDEPIRVAHLANHTAGLPRLPDNLDHQPGYTAEDPYKNYSKNMMMDYLKTVKLDTMPGTVSDYSNLGTALLGQILELVYKEPYSRLVQQYVLTPAGMKQAAFALPPEAAGKMIAGYTEEGLVARPWDMGAFVAAGGLKADITDMTAYLRANINEINADFKLAHQKTFEDAQMGVGMGWMLQTTRDGLHLVWHNGGTGGFSSFCGYITEKKVGVVVLSNSAVNVDGVAIKILKELKRK